MVRLGKGQQLFVMAEIGKITSPKTVSYNCIAWAAGDASNWWEPVMYWPDGIEKVYTMDAYIKAYATKGFEMCEDVKLEDGFEKIAIYADSSNKPKHAARQISEEIWTSKLGRSYDINHPFINEWSEVILEGQKIDLSCYGVLAKLLKRKK